MTYAETVMTKQLGKIEEFPKEYRAALVNAGVTPLWPSMRSLLPHGSPKPVTNSSYWNFEVIRQLLLRAGEFTSVENAERRVLVLSDTGRGVGTMQATASIYLGMQLLLPGEIAPTHRHTPSAARIIVEGKGGFSVVNGNKLPMNVGDIVLTPGGEWHDHGHEGNGPVIWLDVLDLPLFVYLEGSYADESALQTPLHRPDTSQVEYFSSGLIPPRKLNNPVCNYPMVRYPWKRSETALRKIIAHSDNYVAELDYVNPESGCSVLPTLGFTAIMLSAKKVYKPQLRSSSSAFHVIKGSGKSLVNGKIIEWQGKDTFTTPVFSRIEHYPYKETFMIYIHDRPLQEKLGYYEERPQ